MIYSHRGIRYESNCESILNDFIDEHGDDAIIGLEWSLARNPGEWFPIEGTQLYMARTQRPVIRMFFTFDDSVVSVHAIDTE